jgi:hypothetical protein
MKTAYKNRHSSLLGGTSLNTITYVLLWRAGSIHPRLKQRKDVLRGLNDNEGDQNGLRMRQEVESESGLGNERTTINEHAVASE